MDQSQLSQISPNDAFGQVFEQELSSLIRGLEMGVYPMSMFRSSSQRFGGIHFSSSSNTNIVNQEEFEKLKSKLNQTEGKLYHNEEEEELVKT